MSTDRRDPPPTPTGPAGPAAAREARLREALRANLHRRKAQARARAEDDDRREPPDESSPKGKEDED